MPKRSVVKLYVTNRGNFIEISLILNQKSPTGKHFYAFVINTKSWERYSCNNDQPVGNNLAEVNTWVSKNYPGSRIIKHLGECILRERLPGHPDGVAIAMPGLPNQDKHTQPIKAQDVPRYSLLTPPARGFFKYWLGKKSINRQSKLIVDPSSGPALPR